MIPQQDQGTFCRDPEHVYFDPSCGIWVAGHFSENPHMEGGRSHPKPRQTHRGGVSQPRSNAQTRGPFCTRTLTHGVTSECPHSHRGGVHLRPRPTHAHRRGSLEGRPGYVRGLLAVPGYPLNTAGTPIRVNWLSQDIPSILPALQ